MNELELMKHARSYLDQLAQGVDPLDGSPIPDGDVVRQARISRCLLYVSDVLGKVIDNGGIGPRHKEQQPPFSLSPERRASFPYSDMPLSISEIAKRLSALKEREEMKNLSYNLITAYLVECGLLEVVPKDGGGTTRHPTPAGLQLGISLENRESLRGPYQAVLYDRAAQAFILDHLDAVLAPREKAAD